MCSLTTYVSSLLPVSIVERWRQLCCSRGGGSCVVPEVHTCSKKSVGMRAREIEVRLVCVVRVSEGGGVWFWQVCLKTEAGG
jgi:hypothetical protein